MREYLRFWFWIDLVRLVVPCDREFDLILLIAEPDYIRSIIFLFFSQKLAILPLDVVLESLDEQHYNVTKLITPHTHTHTHTSFQCILVASTIIFQAGFNVIPSSSQDFDALQFLCMSKILRY